jgi:NAD(P)H dehydrogenase (quinone)
MKVLIIFDHPRRNSLCGAVLDAVADGLIDAGHAVELADLRAEGFDPRLGPEDEPDWNSEKVYSRAVLAEQARVARNAALCFVFPIWWWSFPATTKGWIDRVWNRGWAYDGDKLTHRKARLLALSSGTAEHYAKRGYDAAMQTQLITGIMNYCGIAEASIDFLHGSLGTGEERAMLLERAGQIGRSF